MLQVVSIATSDGIKAGLMCRGCYRTEDLEQDEMPIEAAERLGWHEHEGVCFVCFDFGAPFAPGLGEVEHGA